MWIATSDRIRTIERVTESEFGITSQVLVERAGLAVFDAIRQLLPEGGRLAVFAGKGLNGADALVAARHANEKNYRIEIFLTAEEEELKPLTRHQANMLKARGIETIVPSDPRWKKRAEMLHAQDLIVDGLVGMGAEGPVRGHVRTAIQAINRSGVPAIAIDIPSGIHGDTGEELGESVWALRTVTFGMPKPFLFQGIGLEHSGYWTVSEIGFPQPLLHEPTGARLIEGPWAASLVPERLRASHKGDNGHVLIVAGSRRMRGAAVLAARAALAAGAGLVTVAGVDEVCDATAHHLPEAMLLPLPSKDGFVAPEAASEILCERNRYSSAVFGPGLGTTEEVREFLRRIWTSWERPSIIDADALDAVSKGIELPKADCVLTPHPGEMSRLMQTSTLEIQADRFLTVRRAAERFGQCILLKGAYSVVGEKDSPLLVNCTGNSGQATGGMGDVLSGVVATLLAQDLPSYYAAACAMFWHGTAADSCAEEIGPIGYRACDVADRLPKARARMVSVCDDR